MHSVTFSSPGEIGFTPMDLLTYWQEMVDLFDFYYSALTGTPTDVQVYAEMLYSLQPPTVVRNDYTTLRV